MSEKDIAERLRDAYSRTGGNSVGDPFVSQIAREIAAVATGERARVRNEALEEARQACAGPDAAWRAHWDGQGVYYACAAAIEALKTKD